MTEDVPDPALVVLVGASGSGKSTWAAARYRTQEIVSSDDLRGIVGSGRHDLDASADAFRLVEQIVAARVARGLATVVDTLGLEPERRRSWLAVARAAGLPAVAVVFETPAELCKSRNAARDRPVPAGVLTGQLKRAQEVAGEVADEGWDRVSTVSTAPDAVPTGLDEPVRADQRPPATVGDVVLQVSRFPWGADPTAWLKGIALAADAAGFAGLALMDHLIQIPQVDRAWEPIPEPFTTLGMLAGLDTHLRLGTLCTPVTFRAAGIIAKTVATLDVLTNGRAFVGLGAGWFEREHQAFGLPFPAPKQRLADVEQAIETMRALWASGTKAYAGSRVNLPETTSYPRPVGQPQIIVGGNGDRTLRIAAQLGDACNLPTSPAFEQKLEIFERHRGDREAAVTVLDLPVIGHDRDDTWARVERLRGRTAASSYARQHHAATAVETRERYERLFDRGVSTVFVGLADLNDAEDVYALAPITGRP
jgi:alkanesulfonate monooxygenase SsuD/methylene tetrahydromethanopterin reductase-like flavin-dependent oxidoreductase (luciferase family)/predicted kinase